MGGRGAMLAVLVVLAAAGGAGAEAESREASAKGRYHALFNFGDSLADAGNLIQNGTPEILATARLPYGQTYFGKPTGRCSDGRLVIDHLGTTSLAFGGTVASASSFAPRFGVPDGFPGLPSLPAAQEFGLPLLPPSKAKNASFAHGANFAITGATALDTDFFQKRGLGKTVWNSGSLFTQIQWLRDLKPSLCSSAQGTPKNANFTVSLPSY